MKPRIVVVGSINMDLVFRTPRMPLVGETITGDGFRQVPGGKGANQAVAAARQGAQVDFVGMIGGDDIGTQALRCLLDEGVGTAFVVPVHGTPTGVAGIFVDRSGSNSIVLAPGANNLLTVELVDQAAATIGDADFMICQLESPLTSVTRAIDIAHAQQVRVVFNPAPAQPVEDSLLAKVDYLIVNETEAAQLSGLAVTDQPSAALAAEALRARGASAVLLTMGGEGVLIAADGQQQHLPALKVEVVDTTAAGDTFVGAFTVGMARGLPLAEAVNEAQVAAAIAVTRMGAQTSIPTRAELVKLMQSHPSARAP